MAIRVTQTVVEVLSRPTADFNESPTSTLTITQSVVESFACLAQLGTVRSQLSNICLGSSAFSDEPQIIQEDILQTLTLVSIVQDLGDELSSQLNIVQSVQATGPFYENITQQLNITQSVLDPQDYPFSITSLLSLTQSVQEVTAENITSNLTIVQFVSDEGIEQILNITQSVQLDAGPGTTNQLALTQTVNDNIIANHSLTSTLNITQKVGLEVVSAERVDCKYSPFVGDGSFPPEPTLTPSSTMVFTFPFVSPTLTVTIRSPEMGNRDRLEFHRINRETIGGELAIFRDPTWPESQALVMEVKNICGDDMAALLDFFKQSIGQDVGLLDYEGRQWKGIVLTPEAEITEIGGDRFTVSFEFQGELQ